MVLHDAVSLAASDIQRLRGGLGPHVVTGPIAVKGARPGDLLKITVLETTPRVPYGVISNRHGRGSLTGEFPLGPGYLQRLRHRPGRRGRNARPAGSPCGPAKNPRCTFR